MLTIRKKKEPKKNAEDLYGIADLQAVCVLNLIV